MPTALVSDLHLGTNAPGADLARRSEVRERLVAAVADADRLVLLGDVLELRERPVRDALETARPLFEQLGEALAGRRVVMVPGNHDHQLAEPWLAAGRLDRRALGPESLWPVEPGDGPAGLIGRWMPRAELQVAYPGLWLREDVYVTHGHYLDAHLTVPRLETLAASAMARLTRRRERCRAPADYEAVLGPLYGLLYGLAQAAPSGALRSGGSFSRRVWSGVNHGGGRRLRRLLLGRVTIPGAVAILNRVGFGPFSPDISGLELRRAGLRAMAAVIEGLGVRAAHVIFGHTHRAGPLPGDDPREGWTLPGGTRLWNAGSWLHEPVLLRNSGRDSPYRPGWIVRLPDAGPPELANALADVEVAAP